MKRKIKTDGWIVARRRRPRLSLSRTVLPFARRSRAFARGRRQCRRVVQGGRCSRSALGDARSRFAGRFATTSSGRGGHRACAEDCARARGRARASGGTRWRNFDFRTNRTDESRGFFGRGIPRIDSPLRNYSRQRKLCCTLKTSRISAHASDQRARARCLFAGSVIRNCFSSHAARATIS